MGGALPVQALEQRPEGLREQGAAGRVGQSVSGQRTYLRLELMGNREGSWARDGEWRQRGPVSEAGCRPADACAPGKRNGMRPGTVKSSRTPDSSVVPPAHESVMKFESESHSAPCIET